MDAVIKKLMPPSAYMDKPVTDRPSQAEVEAAVRVLLRWTGDNPGPRGPASTRRTRVAKAYREMFGGYDMCPADELGRTFEEVAGYDDIVIVSDIPFHSHCEHHMVPIIGKAHVGYLPDGKVRRPVEDRPRGRHLRPPPADAGSDDGADRRRHPGRAATRAASP